MRRPFSVFFSRMLLLSFARSPELYTFVVPRVLGLVAGPSARRKNDTSKRNKERTT